jgi:hypothetical protein
MRKIPKKKELFTRSTIERLRETICKVYELIKVFDSSVSQQQHDHAGGSVSLQAHAERLTRELSVSITFSSECPTSLCS